MGISIGPEEVRELTKTQWKELRKGIEFMTEFATQFPGGIKDVMSKVKESAVGQIVSQITTLLQPLTNELNDALKQITADLGIDDALITIANGIAEVLNDLIGLATTVGELLTDEEDSKEWLRRLKAWMTLIYNNMIPSNALFGYPPLIPRWPF